MAKKITLKDKDGNVLCPHTAIEQVEGLRGALDGKMNSDGSASVDGLEMKVMMAYPMNYSWSNDLNSDSYFKAGAYQTSSATATLNQPDGLTYNTLLTIKGGGDAATSVGQMYFDYRTNGKVYVRTGRADIISKGWEQLRLKSNSVTTSDIADTAITPAKIQTSIALNGTPSMTVEPTTSSPDKTIASVGLVKEVVDNLGIDTRNLIPNSSKIGRAASSTDNYSYVTANLSVGCKTGDVFVFNCDKIENVQGNPTSYTIRLYDTTNKVVVQTATITVDNRTAKFTSTKDVEQGQLCMLVYVGEAGSTAGNECYFYNCSLVKGDKPMLLWQAAPEDIDAKIEAAATKVYYQSSQPTSAKEGDIWIIS